MKTYSAVITLDSAELYIHTGAFAILNYVRDSLGESMNIKRDSDDRIVIIVYAVDPLAVTRFTLGYPVDRFQVGLHSVTVREHLLR